MSKKEALTCTPLDQFAALLCKGQNIVGRASHLVTWQGNEVDTDEALYRQNPQLQIGLHVDEHLQMTSFWIGHSRDDPLIHLKLDHALAITDPLPE